MTPLVGKLDELPLSELLVSIGKDRRTGTLRLARGAQRALLTFREGVAVSARAPGVPRLGDLLTRNGLCDPISVRGASQTQAEEQGQRLLGEILVANGVLSEARLQEVIALQLQLALTELRSWPTGRFQLDLETPRNPHRSDNATATAPPLAARGSRYERGSRSRRAASAPHSPSAESAHARGLRTLEVITADRPWFERLVAGLPAHLVQPVQRSLREALADRTSSSALVLADLRDEAQDPAEVSRLKERRGGVPVLAMMAPESPTGAAYAAGAVAVLPPEPRVVVAAIANLLEALGEMGAVHAPSPARRAPRAGPRAGLRDETGEAEDEGLLLSSRSGIARHAASTTVELDLMRAVSEEVERAILFVVTEEGLLAVGAFGSSASGRPLGAVTGGLRISLDEPNDLTDCARDQTTRCLPFEVARLPPRLAQVLGAPRVGQTVILPVSGGDTTVAIIYADNGEVPLPITDLSRLHSATARFGPTLETELLIREAARTLG